MTIPLTLRPGEVRDYIWDFHLFPEISVNSETLASVTGFSGGGGPPPTLTIGTPSIVNVIVTDADGTVTTYPSSGVQAQISGGVDGTAYELLCMAVTNGGHTLICEGTLYVGQPRTA